MCCVSCCLVAYIEYNNNRVQFVNFLLSLHYQLSSRVSVTLAVNAQSLCTGCSSPTSFVLLPSRLHTRILHRAIQHIDPTHHPITFYLTRRPSLPRLTVLTSLHPAQLTSSPSHISCESVGRHLCPCWVVIPLPTGAYSYKRM